ncbi:hepatoma-derived growth factor-related protein 2-like [Pongo abelii]|uniref:hepatoma-derived growth factor-related protein 2-like n=1 Tax=Pongo abelii TaxID=9601 RepID=UPI0030070A82
MFLSYIDPVPLADPSPHPLPFQQPSELINMPADDLSPKSSPSRERQTNKNSRKEGGPAGRGCRRRGGEARLAGAAGGCGGLQGGRARWRSGSGSGFVSAGGAGAGVALATASRSEPQPPPPLPQPTRRAQIPFVSSASPPPCFPASSPSRLFFVAPDSPAAALPALRSRCRCLGPRGQASSPPPPGLPSAWHETSVSKSGAGLKRRTGTCFAHPGGLAGLWPACTAHCRARRRDSSPL